jgi:hypothetical protein
VEVEVDMKRTLALLLLAASPVAADQVFLKSGGQLTGVLVDRTAASIVIEVAAGRVSIPASRVDHVSLGSSALATFHARASGLDAGDGAGWLALAQWALDLGLQTQARGAFERVVGIDPDNAVARRALGQSLVDGRWLSEADAYRARGFVQFQGAWVTPSERDADLRAQEAQAAAAGARADAEARAREADARAAEAEARRAEAAAQTDAWGGIPYAWILGGYGYGYGHGCGHGYGCNRPVTPVRHPPVTLPAPPAPRHPPVEARAQQQRASSASPIRPTTPR